MSKAIHVTPSGKIRIVEISKDDSLRDLQRLVNGLIQPVDLYDGNTMYVNEEGLIRGYYPNAWATRYANRMNWYSYENQIPDSDDYYIVGDAVIVGPEDEDGNIADAPIELLNDIEQLLAETGVSGNM